MAFTLVSNTPGNILKKNNERMLHSLSEAIFSSVPDPHPIGSVDPDPNWVNVSVSKKAKMTHTKSEKFRVWKCYMLFFGGKRLIL